MPLSYLIPHARWQERGRWGHKPPLPFFPRLHTEPHTFCLDL